MSGGLRPVPGVLPMVIAAAAHGIRRVFVPEPQAAEAGLVPGMTVFGVRSLAQVSAVLRGVEVPEAPPVVGPSASPLATWRGEDRLADLDLADLDGLEDVLYAVKVAAAGGHPLMLVGPRGTGKTTIAERIPTILPDLTIEQSLEVTALHSVAGLLPEGSSLVRRPPCFAPHHDASAASVLGGGTGRVRPGQVSLAHHGVLFLDEFPHFRADVIEAMRQPLESGEVTIARGEESATYPARSLVVLAANPCPCGNFYGGGADGWSCDCIEVQRQHYRRKLSGPIVDRVDVWMEVRPQGVRRGHPAAAVPESSADVRARVTEARLRQAAPLPGPSVALNASVPGPALAQDWPLEPAGQRLVEAELACRTADPARAHPRPAAGLDRGRPALACPDPGPAEAEIALVLRSSDPSRTLPARSRRGVGVGSRHERGGRGRPPGAGGAQPRRGAGRPHDLVPGAPARSAAGARGAARAAPRQHAARADPRGRPRPPARAGRSLRHPLRRRRVTPSGRPGSTTSTTTSRSRASAALRRVCGCRGRCR